jgi:hypothetical protein
MNRGIHIPVVIPEKGDDNFKQLFEQLLKEVR